MPYQIKDGDNYAKIAERIYGDQRMAGELMKANANQPLYAGNQLVLPAKVDDPYISQGQFEYMQSFGDGGETKTSSTPTAGVSAAEATPQVQQPKYEGRASNLAYVQPETEQLQPMSGGKTTADLAKQAEYLRSVESVYNTKKPTVGPVTPLEYIPRDTEPTFERTFDTRPTPNVRQVIQQGTPTVEPRYAPTPTPSPFGTSGQVQPVGGRGSGMEYEMVQRSNDFSIRAKEAAERGDKSLLPKVITNDSFVQRMFTTGGDYEAYLKSIGYKKIGPRKWILTGLGGLTTTTSGYGGGGYRGYGSYYGGGGGGYYTSSTGRGFSLGPINWRIG